MRGLFGVLVFMLEVSACHNPSENGTPAIFRPDRSDGALHALPVQPGDVVTLRHENDSIEAILIDHDLDSGRVWLGFCVLHNKRLLGRQIPNGLMSDDCVDLLDLVYIENGPTLAYSITGNVQLDTSLIGVGAMTGARDMKQLWAWYELGLKDRAKPHSPCGTQLFDKNYNAACYFDVERFTK